MPPSEEMPPSVPAGDGKQHASKTSPLNEDFEKLVHETLDKWHIQGVAVAVIDGDETWAEVISSLHKFCAFTKKLIGIWNRSLARCPRPPFDLVLHRQHDQILHCRGGFFAGRRRREISQYQMDHPDEPAYSR